MMGLRPESAQEQQDEEISEYLKRQASAARQPEETPEDEDPRIGEMRIAKALRGNPEKMRAVLASVRKARKG